jgi:hypothetical protein
MRHTRTPPSRALNWPKRYAEGTLLGQKDLKFLRNMYIIFFFTVPAYMLQLKHRALTGMQIVGIETMWTAFAMYNVIRSSSFHIRLAQLQRRTERGAAETALDDETGYLQSKNIL